MGNRSSPIIRRINNLLTNFEASNKSIDEFREQIDSFQIPTYMILLVLSLNKIPTYGKFGKSFFTCTIRYKDIDFMLKDIKGYMCRIYSTHKSDKIKLLSEEIRTKIVKACDLLDGILSEELMEKVLAGNFFIDNSQSYIHLRRHFERLKKDLNRQLVQSEMRKEFSKLSDLLNFQQESTLRIEEICFSLLNVFFSLTDFIFVIFDIMEDNAPTWKNSNKFMHLNWNEKFKKVLDVKNNQIKFFYDKLLDFKNTIRNPFSHGIIGEYSLLVHLDVIGLVPLSYKKFIPGFQIFGVDSKKAREITKITTEFVNFLESNSPYNFYMTYLSYSLPIPIEKQSLAELKSEMTDIDTFTNFVKNKAQLQELSINFDD
jgi:hypothetical protein